MQRLPGSVDSGPCGSWKATSKRTISASPCTKASEWHSTPAGDGRNYWLREPVRLQTDMKPWATQSNEDPGMKTKLPPFSSVWTWEVVNGHLNFNSPEIFLISTWDLLPAARYPWAPRQGNSCEAPLQWMHQSKLMGLMRKTSPTVKLKPRNRKNPLLKPITKNEPAIGTPPLFIPTSVLKPQHLTKEETPLRNYPLWSESFVMDDEENVQMLDVNPSTYPFYGIMDLIREEYLHKHNWWRIS